MAGVAGEVDEQVDAVLADPGGDSVVGLAPGIAPLVGEAAQPLAGRVGRLDVGVAEDLDGLAVVGAQQRLDEEGDGVLAEVGGDVAHAQPPRRVAIAAVVGPARRGQVIGVLHRPAAVLGEDGHGVMGARVVHQKKQVRMRATEGGVEGDRASRGLDRVAEARLPLQRDGEVLPGERVVRGDVERALVVGDRLAQGARLAERGCEVVVDGGVLGCSGGGLAQGDDRLAGPPCLAQQHPEPVQRVGSKLGWERAGVEGRPIAGFGRGEVPGLVPRRASASACAGSIEGMPLQLGPGSAGLRCLDRVLAARTAATGLSLPVRALGLYVRRPRRWSVREETSQVRVERRANGQAAALTRSSR